VWICVKVPARAAGRAHRRKRVRVLAVWRERVRLLGIAESVRRRHLDQRLLMRSIRIVIRRRRGHAGGVTTIARLRPLSVAGLLGRVG